jgi:hypothetical protein
MEEEEICTGILSENLRARSRTGDIFPDAMAKIKQILKR